MSEEKLRQMYERQKGVAELFEREYIKERDKNAILLELVKEFVDYLQYKDDHHNYPMHRAERLLKRLKEDNK